jgi:hypothetical protein
MNDLNSLLDRAAGPAEHHAPVDAGSDLTRGRRALSRTRRRRSAAGLLGVAAAGVLGVGVVRYTGPDAGPDHGPQQAVEGPADPAPAGISFLAQPLAAGPYTFDATPEGWEVQGVSSSSVTIAPVGFADQDPDSFEGKLAIMFHDNPLTGEQVEREGRTFWIHHSDGYTMIDTPTLPGEPAGKVQIQFPSDTGWDRDSMLTFLGSVHVGEAAQPGVG